MGCPSSGGCVSDYIAVGITCFVVLTVLSGICFIVIRRRDLELNNKKVSVLLVQSCTCLFYLSGVMMTRNYFKLSREHLWDNCYLWTIWLEGPFGFGFLLSCQINRAYRLYYVFILRRLPPLKPYELMTILLLPWFAYAGVMQGVQVMDKQTCKADLGWAMGIASLHIVYPVMLLFALWQVRHVHFKFNEFGELMKGAVVCCVLLVMWGGLNIAERIHENDERSDLKVTSRFFILTVANLFVFSLFWIPLAKPVCDLLRHFKKKGDKCSTMGQAIGVPHSGMVAHPASFDFSRPLEFLLEDKKFRESFLKFAEIRLAAEVVHFYNEVRELGKLHASQVVQRVYLAEHIIDKYIKSGAPMEINLSYHLRMDILNTRDLADPDLFKRAVNEALRMMQMNLLNDYRQSEYFQKLKADREADVEDQYADGLDTSIVTTLEDDTIDNPFQKSGRSNY